MNLVVEDNVFELRDKLPGEFGTPIAIELSDKEQIQDPPPYWFGEVIIRGNVIRHVDGEVNPKYGAIGVNVRAAKKLLVTDNIVDLASPNPFRDWFCGDVRYENNRNSKGEIMLGAEYSENPVVKHHSETRVDLEDVLLL